MEKKPRINVPRYPLSKEARDVLADKLKHMKNREREKTIERLHMYDRGFREKKDNWQDKIEVDDSYAKEAQLKRDFYRRKNKNK